jgi:dUTP pyrophosphatase
MKEITGILWAKLTEEAKIPKKKAENAGYDIYPCFKEDYMIINPHETKLISTGIMSALPEDYYFQIQERGSTGARGIKYSAGVIDSSYRGEWFLALTNTNDKPIIILKNIEKIDVNYITLLSKIAIIYPYEKALFQAIVHNIHNDLKSEEVSYEELETYKTERGDGKLGSSGK